MPSPFWALIATPGWVAVAGCLLAWTLLVIAIVDAQRFIIPDVLTYPLLASGLLVASVMDPAGLSEHVVGAIAGYAGLGPSGCTDLSC